MGGLECLWVDDDLDHKVLLDLSVLESRLVREQLPREEPALVDGVDVFLGLELLLQLAYGVNHADAETQVLSCGQPHLQGSREQKSELTMLHGEVSQVPNVEISKTGLWLFFCWHFTVLTTYEVLINVESCLTGST